MIDRSINIQLIVKGCHENNRNSQRKLFEHFFAYGMNICLRYTKNREEAEEILNSGFLKVFRFIDKYDSAYPFRFWLRKILVNTAVDYYRAHHKQPAFLELKPAVDVADDASFPILNPNEDVLPILQQLSPTYRLVFNLYVMEGYKHDEIAEMLDISASASRSNLTRAKNRLRQIILEDDQNRSRFLKRMDKTK